MSSAAHPVRPSFEWHASAHDRSQFQVVFDYSVRQEGAPEVWGLRPRFRVDLFLVAPRALEVGSSASPKEAFFEQMTQRTCLNVPDLERFSHGDLLDLEHYLALGLDLGARRALVPRVVQEVKLFAFWINEGLREALKNEQLKYKRDLKSWVELVDGFRQRHVEAVKAQGGAVDDEVLEAVLDADAFLSAILEQSLGWAAVAGRRKAKQQMALRLRRPVASDRRALERHALRHRLLKKRISQILYLESHEIHRHQIYRNLAAAMGAGLAALFAETARYYNTVATGTADFSLRVAVFIGLAVVAYVFKDRLKDLSKDYFGRKVVGSLADRESRLQLPYVGPVGEPRAVDVARHQESVQGLGFDALPDDIRYVWERMGGEIARGADTIHYAKELWIEPEALQTLEFGDLSVKEVIRFDTTPFLAYLDEPLTELAQYDEVDGVVIRKAPKVYPLDVVLRVSLGPEGAPDRSVQLDGFRVVLDKSGIVRVEQPLQRGRYRWRIAS